MIKSLLFKQLVPWLALGHGIFNALVLALFCYQGWLGLAIRRARKAGAPLPFVAVRRHRRSGPVLAVLGLAGFLAGLILVILDKGRLVEYPLHFLAGLAIVIVIGLLYVQSRKIKGADSPYRNSHFRLGIALIVLFLVQSVLGVGILL
jgi:hypothetical protein